MYLTQTKIATDFDVRARVAAAAATEGVTDAGIDPNVWADEWRLVWAAAPGWSDAWDSAIAGGIPNPGANESVITDLQILSQVQAMKPFRLIGDVA